MTPNENYGGAQNRKHFLIRAVKQFQITAQISMRAHWESKSSKSGKIPDPLN